MEKTNTEAIAFVRHGFYDESKGGLLTLEGKIRVFNLGEAFGAMFRYKTKVIMSSTAPRARDTARTLAVPLGGCGYDAFAHLLASDAKLSSNQVEWLFRMLVLYREKQVVIVVGHEEFANLFPTEWGNKHGFQIPPLTFTHPASARIIDVATGQVMTLGPFPTPTK